MKKLRKTLERHLRATPRATKRIFMQLGSKIAEVLKRLLGLVIDAVHTWWRACRLNKPISYAFACLLLIGIWLVLGMGPTIQTHLASLITSSEASIYDAAYKNAIHKFPTYYQILVSATDPGVIIPTLVLWCTVLSTTTARTLLIRAYAAAVIGITTTDLLIIIFLGEWNTTEAITCLASNIAGGFILAPIVVLMRSAATFIARFEHNSRATSIVAIFMPVIIGTAISGTVFFTAKLLYDPSPVDYTATVSPDSWGAIGTNTPVEPNEGNKNPKNFQFFDRTKTDSVTWMGLSKPAKFEWGSETPYNLKVYLFAGCVLNDLEPSTYGRPFLSINRVRELSVLTDEGFGDYRLLGEESETLSTADSKIADITISKSENSSIKYVLFTGNDTKITHRKAGTKKLFLSSHLIQPTETRTPIETPRKMEIIVDGRKHVITFIPELSSINPDAKISCTPLRERYVGTDATVRIVSPTVSAVVVIEQTDKEGWLLSQSRQGDDISVIGASGWLTSVINGDNIDTNQLSRGKTDFVVLSGKYDELRVAGAAMPTDNVNSLQAFGGVTDIEIRKNGVIALKGQANALYWNQERLNKTRWERIEIGWATLILSWLAALVLLAYKGIRAALATNYKFGAPL